MVTILFGHVGLDGEGRRRLGVAIEESENGHRKR